MDSVTFEFPVFVNTDVSVLLLLTDTFPNARLVGLDDSCVVAAAPVPLSGMVDCEGEAFVVSTIEPCAVDGVVGAKVTLKVALPPAGIVVEVESPVTLKPVPLTETCENVSVVLPEFVSVMLCEFLLPITTLPKLAELGFAVSDACVPIPLSPIVAGVWERLLVIEMDPVDTPEALGLNIVVKLIF